MNSQTVNLQLGLHSIRVQSMNVNMDLAFDPSVPNQQLFANFGVSSQRVGKGFATLPDGTQMDGVIFITSFEFKFSRSDGRPANTADHPEPPAVANIQADISSTYFGKMFEEMDAESVNRWGATVAVHHQWPYWRELCHSTLSRMSLPVVLMPLHVQAVEIATAVSDLEAKPKKSARRKVKEKF
jgi:hypothetical protein